MSNKKSRKATTNKTHRKHHATNTRRARTGESERWTENQIAEWLIEQIQAHDAGLLRPEQVAQLTGVCPDWLSDDTRFHYGLFMDWTQERLVGFLAGKLDAHDAGTMSPEELAAMNRTMPDWLTDASRIFCGRTPANW